MTVEWPETLVAWYHANRRDLPWHNTRDPYAIWISEIMLQQTRVETVKEYYRRFLQRFPDVQALADAPEQDVLKLWEGLGYYSRARNLQKAAKAVANLCGGRLPATTQELMHLPGVGEYTAGAIASIAYGAAVPAVDGNVKRVTARLFGEREPIEARQTRERINERLQLAVTRTEPGAFNQALMELGATLCTPRAPQCERCPVAGVCDAHLEGDAETLPVHEKKRPPKAVDVAVALLTYHGKVCLFRRSERMLYGLYVFALFEGEITAQGVNALLEAQGLRADFRGDLGEATHVFTHRIWHMRLFHFELLQTPTIEWLNERLALMADSETLLALPLPTAMKAAKITALKLLENKEKPAAFTQAGR